MRKGNDIVLNKHTYLRKKNGILPQISRNSLDKLLQTAHNNVLVATR